MTITRVRAEDVRVGELIEFLGRTHRIVAIGPPTAADIGRFRLALAADDWHYALWDGDMVAIVDEGPQAVAS